MAGRTAAEKKLLEFIKIDIFTYNCKKIAINKCCQAELVEAGMIHEPAFDIRRGGDNKSLKAKS